MCALPISCAARHLAQAFTQGGFQVTTGIAHRFLDILTGSLVDPQQTRYAPVLGLAGAALGNLISQQSPQLFLSVVSAKQLGRAVCREQVGQYVYFSVVSVESKKKT